MTSIASSAEDALAERPEKKATRWRPSLLAAAGVAVLLGSYLYAPYAAYGPTLCPLRWSTGLPCPGCGLTRSFCALARGDWQHSLAEHLLGPILFAALVAAVVTWAAQAISSHSARRLRSWLVGRRAWWAIAAALMVYHAARLLLWAWDGRLLAGLRDSVLATLIRVVLPE